MEAGRQRFLARSTLVVFAAACALWLSRLDYKRKISTDILDLIPPGEAAPEIAVLRSLAGDLQARVMLFALSDPASPAAPPLAAAQKFAGELARSPLFAEVVVLSTSDFGSKFGRRLFELRSELLLPTWLGRESREFARTGRPPRTYSAWLAERAAGRLDAFLARPEAVPMRDLIVRDPLLLMSEVVEAARFLSPPAAAHAQAMVWARIVPSPLTEAGQAPVFAAIARAEAEARARRPGLELVWSGVNRFAAASRMRIEKEIKWLNFFSLAAVLAVGSVFLRRLWKIVLLFPVVGCAYLGAWTASTLVFPRLHILVFVVGSLLSGVAIDYGFYIYLQPPSRPGETYGEKLARLRRPLLASCLTTVLGFSLLIFSDLPFIRQVGFFVSAGLLSALGSAVLYFAQFQNPYLEARRWGPVAAASDRPGRRRLLHGLFFAAMLVALSTPWRLRWKDDVRELDTPAPRLVADEERLRSWAGQDRDNSLFLTYGSNAAEARQRLETFLDYERRQAGGGRLVSLGAVFPTEADWRLAPQRRAQLDSFAADFRAALSGHGYDPDAFGAFFSDWNALPRHPAPEDYADIYGLLAGSITGPLAQLYEDRGSLAWFITLGERVGGPPPPAAYHTVNLDELRSLNGLFTRYRWSALRLSLIGLALVVASVFLIYRGRTALRIALIPAGSCFFVLGILAISGQPLNLFHLLGAFLGLCLAHNYAIFSAESSRFRQAPPTAVRLSACCAAASFAVLACSRIPVVHALGLTVALIVLAALAAVELEPNARRPA